MGSRIFAIVVIAISLSGAGYYALQSQDRAQSLRAAESALRALETNRGRIQNKISKLKRKQNAELERAKKNYVSNLAREHEIRKNIREKLKNRDASMAKLRSALEEEKKTHEATIRRRQKERKQIKLSLNKSETALQREREALKLLQKKVQEGKVALAREQRAASRQQTDLNGLRSSLEKEKESRGAIIRRGLEESKQFKIKLNESETALQREREALKQLQRKMQEEKTALAREQRSALRRQADLDRLRAAIAGTSSTAKGIRQKLYAAKAMLAKKVQEVKTTLAREQRSALQHRVDLDRLRDTLTGTSSTAEENQQKLSAAKVMLAKMEKSRKKIQKKALLLSTEVQRETRRAQKLERDVAVLSRKLTSQQVTLRQTKKMFQIDIIEHLLFDVGQTRIKKRGLAALNRIAAFLKKHPGRETRVEGHTDNLPISGTLARRYPTNWELSSARAIRVVRNLQSMGVSAERLSATGRSFYSPVASNNSESGRSKNRRIVILMGRTKNVKNFR